MILVAAALAGCKKDGPFKGKDNDIASFQLTAGGVVLKAYIQQDSIVITVPGGFSLAGAVPQVLISERAQISPDPASITDWGQSHQFIVTSYDGMKRTFMYVLMRNQITTNGDIVLTTQAEVDSLAKIGISQINGSLTIGKADGTDSIRSLAGLSSIQTIVNNLVINPTFAGKDLTGLDNLQRIGSFKMGPDPSAYQQGTMMNLKTINLPKLTEIMAGMLINSPGIAYLQMPLLKSVGGDLQIIYIDSLVTMEFPKLESVLKGVFLSGYFIPGAALKTISFPVLTTVGGDVYIYQWANLETVKFPALTSAASFTVIGETLLTFLDASHLQATTKGPVELSFNTSLKSFDLSALQSVAGQLHIESCDALTDINSLKSLVSVGGDVTIGSLGALTSLAPLKGLKTVGGNFFVQVLNIQGDPGLSAFSGLRTIGGDMQLYAIDGLTNVNGFSALTSAHRVLLFSNPVLVDYTGLKNVLGSLGTSDNWTASGNGYDPSYQDLLDGKYVQP